MIEYIQICSSAEKTELLLGHIARHELAHGVTYEQIGVLDVVPEILPDFLLGRTFDVHKVASNFDVRTIDNGNIRPDFLY